MSAGDLTMVLERKRSGIRLLNLFDSQTASGSSAADRCPCSRSRCETPRPGRSCAIDADSDGASCRSRTGRARRCCECRRVALGAARGQAVGRPARAARAAVPDAASQRHPHGNCQPRGRRRRGACGVSCFRKPPFRISGPRQLRAFSRKAAARCSGVSGAEPFRFTGTYPSGWTTMQFLAAYGRVGQTGLYLAVHDPWGSTKDLLVRVPAARTHGGAWRTSTRCPTWGGRAIVSS